MKIRYNEDAEVVARLRAALLKRDLQCPCRLQKTEDKNLITRPALHSYELWFTQPVTGQDLHFTAPIPQDMQRLLE